MGRARIVRTASAVSAAVVLVVGCAGDGDDGEPADSQLDQQTQYLEALQGICAETNAELDELPAPPEQITIADFAAAAASALTDESEQVRQLEPPDELDADHRAFIANTDEQAGAWQALGSTPETDAEALAEATTRVAELTLGRSDLAAEIGADDCVRAPG